MNYSASKWSFLEGATTLFRFGGYFDLAHFALFYEVFRPFLSIFRKIWSLSYGFTISRGIIRMVLDSAFLESVAHGGRLVEHDSGRNFVGG